MRNSPTTARPTRLTSTTSAWSPGSKRVLSTTCANWRRPLAASASEHANQTHNRKDTHAYTHAQGKHITHHTSTWSYVSTNRHRQPDSPTAKQPYTLTRIHASTHTPGHEHKSSHTPVAQHDQQARNHANTLPRTGAATCSQVHTSARSSN